MKKFLVILLTTLFAVSLILPAAADVIWEPPEEPDPVPDETLPLILDEPDPDPAAPENGESPADPDAGQNTPLIVALVVTVIIIAAGLLVWFILGYRSTPKPKGE